MIPDESQATAKREGLLNKVKQLEAVVLNIQNTLEPGVGEKLAQDTPKPANKLLQVVDILDVNIVRLHKMADKLQII